MFASVIFLQTTENLSAFSGFLISEGHQTKTHNACGEKMTDVKVSFFWVIEVIIGNEQVSIDKPTEQEKFKTLRDNQQG